MVSIDYLVWICTVYSNRTFPQGPRGPARCGKAGSRRAAEGGAAAGPGVPGAGRARYENENAEEEEKLYFFFCAFAFN